MVQEPIRQFDPQLPPAVPYGNIGNASGCSSYVKSSPMKFLLGLGKPENIASMTESARRYYATSSTVAALNAAQYATTNIACDDRVPAIEISVQRCGNLRGAVHWSSVSVTPPLAIQNTSSTKAQLLGH